MARLDTPWGAHHHPRMTSRASSPIGRSALVALALGTLIAACGGSGPTPSVGSGNKPTVVVQSPTNGAVLAVGQNVAVTGAASDTVGVDHVALFADGVSVASSPSAAPAPLVPFSLAWLATPAGPHVLQVIAYRADGTPSDPAVVNLVVGAAGSGLPLGSGLSSFAVPSVPALITPAPTKKPKPSKNPPTPTPPATPTPTPTPTTPLPTMDTNGNAPDDSDAENYQITLNPHNTACPPIDNGAPVVASGCIWEQISAPDGDKSDLLEFKQDRNTTYRMGLTSCTDNSGTTYWSDTGQPSTTGCNELANRTSSGGDPGSLILTVAFLDSVTTQTYNLYQFTVYQCQFADCANQ